MNHCVDLLESEVMPIRLMEFCAGSEQVSLGSIAFKNYIQEANFASADCLYSSFPLCFTLCDLLS